MKTQLLKVLVVSAVVGGSSVAVAAQDLSRAELRRICFEKHKNRMDKPALRNPYDCYRMHGYLMAKQT